VGSRESGETPTVEDKLSSYVFIINFFLGANLFRIYLVFSPYCIRLCSPPPVESRATLGQAPLQRGCCLIYTRNTHRGEILMCLLEVG
jgi:hypothetical protein